MLTLSLPTEDPAGLSVAAWRRIQAGQVVNSASSVPRTGIITGAPLLVTGTSDPAMTYRIGQFVGASSRDGVGVEFTANDASETVGTDIAPQANSRIDVIWFRAPFPSLTDAGQTKPLFGVKRGVADANPQKPTIPAGAEELATAVVTSTDLATQTVVITNTFRWTAYAGGTVPLRSKAEQDAWAPADGATAYRIDEGVHLRRTGGAWVPTSGPFINLIGNGTLSAAGSTNLPVWATPGSGGSVATPGWFAYDPTAGDIKVLKAGRYEIEARIAVAPVSGASVSFYILRNGTPQGMLTQDSVTPNPNFGGIAKLSVLSVDLAANDTVRAWVPANGIVGGPVTIGGAGRGLCEFRVRAVG